MIYIVKEGDIDKKERRIDSHKHRDEYRERDCRYKLIEMDYIHTHTHVVEVSLTLRLKIEKEEKML